MAKSREATPVTLTDEQRDRLENLWFIYGNHGPKTTPGNHQFIQSILEQGIDLRPLINSRSRKSEIPTPECVAAVEKVLAEPVRHAERHSSGELRLVTPAEEARPRLEPSDELKALLDDMRRRYQASREKLEGGDDPPDAA